jgi:hypothetical protein
LLRRASKHRISAVKLRRVSLATFGAVAVVARSAAALFDAVVRFAGRAMQDNSAKPRNFNPMSIPCLSDEARKAVSASF